MSYKSIIDKFYRQYKAKFDAGRSAPCNYFAQDILNEMDESLPNGNCRTMLSDLRNGYSNWKRVSVSEAQKRANAGYGTVGITYDHIVVIYPHGNTAHNVRDLYMSMAGYAVFNNTKITEAWSSDRLSEIKFYSYFPSQCTCDTHSTVTIKCGNKYTARITCSQYPKVVAGTGGIVSISLASRSGSNYYFAFTGVKAGSTGIYINDSASAVFVCKVV